MIMQIEDSLDHFCVQWERWENAIIGYSKASKTKPAYLQSVLDSMDENDPGLYMSVFNVNTL